MSMKVTGEKALDLSTAKDPLSFEVSTAVAFGVTDGKMDELFHDERTLAISTSEDLDIVGTLTNAFGDVVNLLKVDAIMFKNVSVNANLIEIGPAAANGFGIGGPWKAAGDANSLGVGGSLMIMAPTAGWAAVAGTADLITVNNTTAAEGKYQIAVLGRAT
jgi:hypothetical protein